MMTGLVTLIVLAYLLIIAVCLAIWSAVSLGRTSAEPAATRRGSGERRPEARDARHERTSRRQQAQGETSHDAYRGARAHRAAAPLARTDAAAAVAPGVQVRAVRSPATQDRLFAADGTPVPELPSGAVRVAESRRARERSAEDAPARGPAERSERSEHEDPFDRFLRANRDLDA